MGIERYTIEHSVHVNASPEAIWQEITQVDIASFNHPVYLSILGIPKPLRAEVIQTGVGGARIAYFANNRRFCQNITEWIPPERYAFTFKADPGFRVAYFLDLSDGPFQMTAGAYRIWQGETNSNLFLMSEYELRGLLGICMRLPVRLVLHFFQLYLLRGIRANAERRERQINQAGNL